MPTLLICWELGGGWGHAQSLRPLVRELLHRGHHVTLAARELTRCVPTFAGLPVRLLQAPLLATRHNPPFARVRCFAHLLANVGYDSPGNLIAAVTGWRGIYELVRPDAVLAEYAPTALLALRGTGVPRAPVGTGFTLPPDLSPLPTLTGPEGPPLTPDDALRDEAAVLRSTNAALAAWHGRPLTRLADLFHDEATTTFLRTTATLDPFAPRPGVRYWGAWPSEGGDAPEWPTAPGPRLFVYARACPARDALLAEAHRVALPTLVAAEDLSPALAARITGPTVRVATRRLDLARVLADGCALAILNGGHNTLAAALTARVPCLLLPLQLEQYLLARRAEAARIVPPHDPASAVATLAQSLADRIVVVNVGETSQRETEAPGGGVASVDAVVREVEDVLLQGKN